MTFYSTFVIFFIMFPFVFYWWFILISKIRQLKVAFEFYWSCQSRFYILKQVFINFIKLFNYFFEFLDKFSTNLFKVFFLSFQHKKKLSLQRIDATNEQLLLSKVERYVPSKKQINPDPQHRYRMYVKNFSLQITCGRFLLHISHALVESKGNLTKATRVCLLIRKRSSSIIDSCYIIQSNAQFTRCLMLIALEVEQVSSADNVHWSIKP